MDILKLLEMTLSATLRMGTPLLLASVGGMFASRCGIMPLGVEGMITIGAFSAVVGSHLTANPWLGLLMGISASTALALLNGWLCIRCHVNHIIGGLGLNMLVAALVGIFLQTMWGSSTNSPPVASIKGLDLPLLADIPLVGALFTGQFLVTYLAILLVPLTWFCSGQNSACGSASSEITLTLPAHPESGSTATSTCVCCSVAFWPVWPGRSFQSAR